MVSCQASQGDPLEDTDAIRRIALAAVNGGAAGLRINSAQHIAAIRRHTSLPIIGIRKIYIQGRLRITPDFESAAELAAAGASIIALDCTNREWPTGDPWRVCIERIHRELNLPVMADIATLEVASKPLRTVQTLSAQLSMAIRMRPRGTQPSIGLSWPSLSGRRTGRSSPRDTCRRRRMRGVSSKMAPGVPWWAQR